MNILVLNCGSSSIKYQLFEPKKKVPLARGLIEEIGKLNSFQTHWIGKRIIKKKGKIVHYQQGLERILDFLTDKNNGLIKDTSEIFAVGHRVVHGGEKYFKPILIDDKVMETIRSYIFLAPLHNYPNLMGIEAARNLLRGVPQVAVFDTAFHQTLPPKVFLYALPYEYYKKYRIRRYGFHGTSHRYVAYEAAKILRKPLKNLRIITCHLGNGCSIAAIDKGESIDTSMGFTPLEGLVMGTRCGDIDAAVVLFLMKKEKLEINQMDNILNKQSGLLGISGLSNDLREIQRKAQKGNRRAKLALEIFIYRVKKYIGAYSAILGGLDVLVFTAGIGENQPDVRSRICQGLGFLGIYLDEKENKAPSRSARLISAETSPGKVLVIPTNEEAIIADETWQVVRKLVARLF